MSSIRDARREIEELRGEVKELRREVREYKSLLFTTLSLMNRTGLRTAGDIQRMVTLLNQLRLAYLAVQAARMAAGDPIAWAQAVVTTASAAVSMYEVTGR